MASVVKMPQLAAGEETATVQAWLVDAGDAVAVGQPIVEVETEKATVDYEAEVAGVFAGSLVEAGTTVEVGSVIAVIAAIDEDADAALAAERGGSAPSGSGAPAPAGRAAEAAPASKEPAAAAANDGDGTPPESVAAPSDPATVPSREPAAAPSEGPPADDHVRRFASPLARSLAKEHDVPLAQLEGTGPGGRVVRRDIEAFLEERPSGDAQPESGGARAGGGDAAFEDVPHTGMRRAIARRLTESKTTVPHFYLVADVRVDALLALRQQVNVDREARISVNDFVLKAVAAALRDVPDANAIWTDDATRRFSDVDIAVAISVPGGLLTPVLRNVESMPLSEISTRMRDFAERARAGRIKQDELVGGSFSVSNLGMYGTKEFSAILNPPQAGILAVGAAEQRPVVGSSGELEIGTVMTVTLSADHRVLDGALGAEWLAAFVRRIEHPLTMLV